MTSGRQAAGEDVRRGFDFRRVALLVMGLGALVVGLTNYWTSASEGGRMFASNSALRIGVVLMALWLALPALKKPMSWLPPGVAAMCLLGLGAIAAQPRLLVVVVPAVGFLLSLAWVVRLFRARHPR